MKIPAHITANMSWYSRKPCACGSGEETCKLTDARGIHVTLCCDACVVEKAKGYRREIFEDRQYQADDLGDER